MPTDKVQTPSDTYNSLIDDWNLVGSLWGGTKAMRVAGRDYLPQEPAESDEAYDIRLQRSVLFNALKRTIRTLAGKPFSRPVGLGEGTDSMLLAWLDDVDLQGTDLDTFARDCFEAAVRDGVSYILVDFPKTADEMTLADEQSAGVRPYLVNIDCRQVIGWQTAPVGGRDRLVQVRIREDSVVADGDFGEAVAERIRVLEPGSFRVFERVLNDDQVTDWLLVDEGSTPGMSDIPLVAVYTHRTGFMQATPPLRDLAHLNVEHWQSSSDQGNILHYARVPLLLASGFGEGDLFEIGPNRVIQHPDTQATLSYVEHSGRAISAGRDSIQDIQDRMRVLGMELMVGQRTGSMTATERALDQAQFDSELAGMVRSLESSLEDALGLMGAWAGMADVTDGVDIHQDFGISLRDVSDVDSLLKSRAAGDLSQATFLAELKRRGLLMASLEVEDERELIAAEAPAI